MGPGAMLGSIAAWALVGLSSPCECSIWAKAREPAPMPTPRRKARREGVGRSRFSDRLGKFMSVSMLASQRWSQIALVHAENERQARARIWGRDDRVRAPNPSPRLT